MRHRRGFGKDWAGDRFTRSSRSIVFIIFHHYSSSFSSFFRRRGPRNQCIFHHFSSFLIIFHHVSIGYHSTRRPPSARAFLRVSCCPDSALRRRATFVGASRARSLARARELPFRRSFKRAWAIGGNLRAVAQAPAHDHMLFRARDQRARARSRTAVPGPLRSRARAYFRV